MGGWTLYDAIMDDPATPADLVGLLSVAVRVNVQNVFWYLCETRPEVLLRPDYEGARFTPPWEVGWYEYEDGASAFFGFLVVAETGKDWHDVLILESVACEQGGYIPGSLRWCTEMLIAKDGSIVAYDSNPKDPEDVAPFTDWRADHNIAPVLFAMALSNCKNVSFADERVRSNRVVRKATGQHHVTIKTLAIDPMRGAAKGVSLVGQDSPTRALHICRGHFKTYTPERPLLGRAAGTYWWHETARGSASAGLVLKDYAVKAPAGAPA